MDPEEVAEQFVGALDSYRAAETALGTKCEEAFPWEEYHALNMRRENAAYKLTRAIRNAFKCDV